MKKIFACLLLLIVLLPCIALAEAEIAEDAALFVVSDIYEEETIYRGEDSWA